MEQQTQKKEWNTPKLIILVRSKPEEVVLATCKGGSLPNSAPNQNWDGCQKEQPCVACDLFATS